MNASGFVTVMAGSLNCSIDNSDWYFSIRSTVDKTHKSFFDFHNKTVSPSEIELNFLPNWSNIQWNEIPNSILSKSESYAQDIEFQVNVQAIDSSSKTHKEVVNAFLTFMRNHQY